MSYDTKNRLTGSMLGLLSKSLPASYKYDNCCFSLCFSWFPSLCRTVNGKELVDGTMPTSMLTYIVYKVVGRSNTS